MKEGGRNDDHSEAPRALYGIIPLESKSWRSSIYIPIFISVIDKDR